MQAIILVEHYRKLKSMKSPQEEAPKSRSRVKVLVSDCSRTGISWQEVLAVIFGIRGGVVYCILTKQSRGKKKVIFLLSCLFWLSTTASPLYKQASESERGSSRAALDSAPLGPSYETIDSTHYSSPPSSQSNVDTDCSYGVCTRTYTSQNGDLDIYSDGYGESYNVHSRSYESDGKTTIKSWDSEGNSYNVDSYCDSTGCHSSDTEGNRCSVLSDGTMVGCD